MKRRAKHAGQVSHPQRWAKRPAPRGRAPDPVFKFRSRSARKIAISECGCEGLIVGLASSLPSAVSSVVEHYLDTVGVTGSNPVSRTTH
jgi:hypothetical protein